MSLTIILKDKQIGEYAGDADLGDVVTVQLPDGSYVTGEVDYLIDSNDLGEALTNERNTQEALA